MEGFLGEFAVDINTSIFAAYTHADWAMYYIGSYGQLDGAHHKQWVLDQVARILKGTAVVVKEARWANGHSEYRITLEEPSQEYLEWVAFMRKDTEDGEEYEYDEGLAP